MKKLLIKLFIQTQPKKNSLPYVFLLVKACQLQIEESQTLQGLQDEQGLPQPQYCYSPIYFPLETTQLPLAYQPVKPGYQKDCSFMIKKKHTQLSIIAYYFSPGVETRHALHSSKTSSSFTFVQEEGVRRVNPSLESVYL